MVEIFLIIIGIIYLIYRITFGVSKDIKRLEDKIDVLKLHLQEIELKLNHFDENINSR